MYNFERKASNFKVILNSTDCIFFVCKFCWNYFITTEYMFKLHWLFPSFDRHTNNVTPPIIFLNSKLIMTRIFFNAFYVKDLGKKQLQTI